MTSVIGRVALLRSSNGGCGTIYQRESRSAEAARENLEGFRMATVKKVSAFPSGEDEINQKIADLREAGFEIGCCLDYFKGMKCSKQHRDSVILYRDEQDRKCATTGLDYSEVAAFLAGFEAAANAVRRG